MTPMTVTELTKRILPEVSEAELAATVRQLRYWTLEQVFPTLDYASIKTGRGHHREYEGDTVLLAALAIELGSRWRLSAMQLKGIMVGIDAQLGLPSAVFDRFRANWAAAIAGRPDVFLVIQLPRTSAVPAFVLDLVGFGEIERYVRSGVCVSTIVIDLSALFARLRG
jgi:hypothetical protein